jgi:hypothetical protein
MTHPRAEAGSIAFCPQDRRFTRAALKPLSADDAACEPLRQYCFRFNRAAINKAMKLLDET